MKGRASSSGNLEADKISPYLGFLFVMLSTATLFEGFDSAMFSFAAPDVRESLNISREEWGYVSSLTRLGVLASFIFVAWADSVGRRMMMLLTIIGFTVFNGLTAFARTAEEFVVYQLLARLFLTAEYAIAVIVIGEEFPARWRGRAVAILTSLATVGVMIVAKVQAFVLLEESQETNWLHDLGTGMVSTLSEQFGLGVDPSEDWRALYMLGALPLVLILVLRIGMRETRRFDAVSARYAESAVSLSLDRGSLKPFFTRLMAPWQAQYRHRTIVVIILWNCVHVVLGPSAVYWVIFAREDVGLSTSEVGDVVFWGYAGGIIGHYISGWSIDRLGRKATCSASYVGASLAILGMYHTPTLAGQYVFMVSTLFFLGAALSSTHVYASELFPTEIRATGYGWTSNLLGRVTEVATPAIIGLLIVPLGGLSMAITAVVLGPIVGAIVVMFYAPETRGLTLEEIQERVS